MWMKATQKGLNILKVKKVTLNNIYEIFPLIDVLQLYEIEQDSSNCGLIHRNHPPPPLVNFWLDNDLHYRAHIFSLLKKQSLIV